MIMLAFGSLIVMLIGLIIVIIKNMKKQPTPLFARDSQLFLMFALNFEAISPPF